MNISSFDTSKVTDMIDMLHVCHKFNTVIIRLISCMSVWLAFSSLCRKVRYNYISETN